jgi:hypothetical protein
MPRKRVDRLDEWISGLQAAIILTANSGHEVSPDYVRRLGNTGKLTTRAIDGRTKLYLKSDVEAYRVEQRGKQEAA